jgi:hypothetical protein
MEKLDSENKQYLLSVIKPKALNLKYTELEKFIESDPNKPTNYQQDEIDEILGDLYVNKIGTKTGEEKKSIINNFFTSNDVTLHQPSTSVSSTVSRQKLSKPSTNVSAVTRQKQISSKSSSDPNIVFKSNPLIKKKEEDEKKKEEDDKLEADALNQNNLLQLQLDLDQIIYTKLDPKLKKKQLALIVNNLKDKLETYKTKIDRGEYEEELKKKLPKKNGLNDDKLFDLFYELIDQYFTSYAIILSLIPLNNPSGGLSFRHVDTEDQQMVYRSELDQAKDIKKIIKKIEDEKNKQKNTQNKIDNKIKAINSAYQKKIHFGDTIQCTHKLTKNQIGEIIDINYIPGKISGYTVELIIKNELGENQKENLSSCKVLSAAEVEAEKKKQAEIEEKTDLISKQVARQYGFKIGDPIDCTTKDGKNISGIAKKFKYNLLKRKTYILIKEKGAAEDAELTQIDVKYCANEYDYTLRNINKMKEREYMKKQFKKLQEIIKKINKLNPSDENYEFIIKNLTNEYDIIESQINNTMQTSSESSSKCSDSDEDCKRKASPRDNPDIRLINTEDERLNDVRNKRIALLQLIQKIKPDEYLQLNTIFRRRIKSPSLDSPGVGVALGGKNTYAAKLNQKNIKFKNGKLPILNTVKGGYNTFGLTQKYMQRAGSDNIGENIPDIINNSINLLNIMDKTL